MRRQSSACCCSPSFSLSSAFLRGDRARLVSMQTQELSGIVMDFGHLHRGASPFDGRHVQAPGGIGPACRPLWPRFYSNATSATKFSSRLRREAGRQRRDFNQTSRCAARVRLAYDSGDREGASKGNRALHLLGFVRSPHIVLHRASALKGKSSWWQPFRWLRQQKALR